jgi:hypothetical protein
LVNDNGKPFVVFSIFSSNNGEKFAALTKIVRAASAVVLLDVIDDDDDDNNDLTA